MIYKDIYCKIFLTAGVAWLTATAAAATGGDPLARLGRFLELDGFRAEFTQTVYDAGHNVVAASKGRLLLSRPGRFRWEYTEPSGQIIVNDGLNLIVYDADLDQASVQPAHEVLGDAPITLLGGEEPLDARFHVKTEEAQEGLDWIALTPKSNELEFVRIRLGLYVERVVRMEMFDRFDQRTDVEFSHFELNPEIAADAFRVELPKTTDVVGEYLFPIAQ